MKEFAPGSVRIQSHSDVIEIFNDPKAFIDAIESRPDNPWFSNYESRGFSFLSNPEAQKAFETAMKDCTKFLKQYQVVNGTPQNSVSLILALGTPYCIDPKVFSLYLDKMTELGRTLEEHGIPVSLYASCTFADCWVNFGYNGLVKIKDQTQDIDWSKCRAFLDDLLQNRSGNKSNEAMLFSKESIGEYMTFRWYETLPGAIRIPGYGFPMQVADQKCKTLQSLYYRDTVEQILKNEDAIKRPLILYCGDRLLQEPDLFYKKIAELGICRRSEQISGITKDLFGADEIGYPKDIDQNREEEFER